MEKFVRVGLKLERTFYFTAKVDTDLEGTELIESVVVPDDVKVKMVADWENGVMQVEFPQHYGYRPWEVVYMEEYEPWQVAHLKEENEGRELLEAPQLKIEKGEGFFPPGLDDETWQEALEQLNDLLIRLLGDNQPPAPGYNGQATIAFRKLSYVLSGWYLPQDIEEKMKANFLGEAIVALMRQHGLVPFPNP